MAILILNATIASVQEIKSVKSLGAISQMADNQTARWGFFFFVIFFCYFFVIFF